MLRAVSTALQDEAIATGPTPANLVPQRNATTTNSLLCRSQLGPFTKDHFGGRRHHDDTVLSGSVVHHVPGLIS